jgi:hypothetical protein
MHLAGIVPVAQLETDYSSITPDVLTLLAPDYTAIQNAVMSCAMAGCKTIWIVANNDVAPLVKKAVGEWVHDPVYYKRDFTKFYSNVRKEVPIYYTPVHPKDLDRRNSYGWSVLHGIYSSWFVSYKISRWIIPEKYFIAFPMSVYDYRILRELRPQIQDANNNFSLTYKNQTVMDNLPISFTMKGEDYLQCRRNVNKITTREYLPPSPGQLPSVKRPLSERWSARYFDLSTVFAKWNLNQKIQTHELDWFYDIREWEQYRAYMASDHVAVPPYREIYKPRFYNLEPLKETDI